MAGLVARLRHLRRRRHGRKQSQILWISSVRPQVRRYKPQLLLQGHPVSVVWKICSAVGWGRHLLQHRHQPLHPQRQQLRLAPFSQHMTSMV